MPTGAVNWSCRKKLDFTKWKDVYLLYVSNYVMVFFFCLFFDSFFKANQNASIAAVNGVV